MLPLVGREEIQEKLFLALESARGQEGHTVILTGERGAGKSSLCGLLEARARERGFRVAAGRAFLAESGVPYSLCNEALLPLLRAQEPETIDVLTRGGSAALSHLFPGLPGSVEPAALTEEESAGQLRNRMLWTLAELLRGLSRRAPLCVVFEDLQWADSSSLEAIHFLARHLAGSSTLLMLTRDEPLPEREGTLAELERSLSSLGLAETLSLPPLTREDTGLLLKKAFGVGRETAGEFADHLHRWTQGNPFFLQETLKGLVESGQLHRKGDAWLGWDVGEMELPGSIRDVIGAQMRELPPQAQALAEMVAILGNRAPFSLLRVLAPLPEPELLENLELLVKRDVLTEELAEEGVVYHFRQQLMRETILKELGLARTQILHRRIAESLEDLLGTGGDHYNALLAYHHMQAGGPGTPATVRRLATAGREALARFGNPEAAQYLEAALGHLDRNPSWEHADLELDGGRLGILMDLARARTELGRYDAALECWERAYRRALDEGAPSQAAECRLQAALIHNSRGEPALALSELAEILATPAQDLPPASRARARLHRAMILVELGQAEEGREELESLLTLEGNLSAPGVAGQAHRALANLYIWTGQPDRVRSHAERAMQLARRSGNRFVEFWAFWSLAALEGLLGNVATMKDLVLDVDRLAREAGSPLLRLRSLELEIELSAALGDWDSGIVKGEQAIAMARTFSEKTALPRVLVWTALIYLAKGNRELAGPLIQEAWEASGAGGGRRYAVHGAVPAYIGRGYLALADGDFDEAIRIGREGLEIAEGVGYEIWTLHRLLPLLAEAYLWKGDLTGAKEVGARLREKSAPIGHRLGLALAQSCEALVTWLEGDPNRGSDLMEEAARALEAIPMTGEAARLRRLRAGRLAELGDRSGALEELNSVHEVFLVLGAKTELEKTRAMFRELGARPPRRAKPGGGDLSSRELEIARLVEERKSNKAIARCLGISPRTVSTHLSNIYQKLGIGSRGELVDYLRSEGLTGE